MKVKLYGWNDSPFCLKVRMAAKYKGVELEEVSAEMSDLKRNERRTGYHKVPFIEGEDDLWITDSTRILEWLDERGAGDRRLYPEDPARLTECRLLEDWADEALNSVAEPVWVTKPGVAKAMMARMAVETHAGAVMRFLLVNVGGKMFRKKFVARAGRVGGTEAAHALMLEQLDLLEARLEVAGTPWLLGDAPTAADFAVAGQCRNLYFFEVDGVAECTRLQGLVERAMELVPQSLFDSESAPPELVDARLAA